jgi:peptide/nickel transport system substrate-binding protein
MAKILGRGTAEPAKGPLPPAMRYYDHTVSQAPYDPIAARELLKTTPLEARTVRLVFTDAIGLISEMAGAVRSDLERIGLNVEFVGKPSFREVVAAALAREGDMFIYNWHVSAPFPERLLMPLFASKATQTNLTRYRNVDVDNMLEEAMRLPEGTEQQHLYSRIQRTIVADAPMAFLFHWTRMSAQHKRVKGLEPKLDSSPSDKLVNVDLEP